MAMVLSARIAVGILSFRDRVVELFIFVLVPVPYLNLNVRPKKEIGLKRYIDAGFMVLLLIVFIALPGTISNSEEFGSSYGFLLVSIWICGTALFMSKDAIRAAWEHDEDKT